MREFGPRLSAIEIVPWDDATFDVRVGERLVHSMARDGGFPSPEMVAAEIRAALDG